MTEKLVLAYKDVGYKFTTGTRMVTPGDLDLFVAASGEREPAFLSDEVAKAVGLKARIIPVGMMLAVKDGLIGEYVQGALFLGMNNVKWSATPYPYDTFRVEGELLNKRETSKGDRFIITYSWTIKNQDDVTIAQGESTEIFAKPKDL